MKDLSPVAECQVAGQQQATAFVAISEHLEEQLGAATAERAVSQLVTNQQLDMVQLPQQAVQLVLLLLLFKEIDQGRGREITNPERLTAGGQTQADGQVGFARAHTTHQATVGMLPYPFTTGQLQNLRLVERGQSREIVAVQFLEHREAGVLDACRQSIGRARRQFQLRQPQ